MFLWYVMYSHRLKKWKTIIMFFTYNVTKRHRFVLAVNVSLYSSEGWDQECCYSRSGELILKNKDRGVVIRMSADRQPFPYLHQEYWPKVLCTMLANNRKGYLKTRPSDDCSNYREPSKHGTWLIVFRLYLFYRNYVHHCIRSVNSLHHINSP